jgi:hypothetical protein
MSILFTVYYISHMFSELSSPIHCYLRIGIIFYIYSLMILDYLLWIRRAVVSSRANAQSSSPSREQLGGGLGILKMRGFK